MTQMLVISSRILPDFGRIPDFSGNEEFFSQSLQLQLA
jgi:hypothetical protein